MSYPVPEPEGDIMRFVIIVPRDCITRKSQIIREGNYRDKNQLSQI